MPGCSPKSEVDCDTQVGNTLRDAPHDVLDLAARTPPRVRFIGAPVPLIREPITLGGSAAGVRDASGDAEREEMLIRPGRERGVAID